MITNTINKITRITVGSLLLLAATSSCERDVKDLQPASFPKNPNVFIDDFSAGLNYAAFGGSNPKAFEVDKIVTWNGSVASMRFDVPAVNDPRGAYAGGAFFVDGGRDLSSYNVLTFWAKASQNATIDLLGFGNYLGANTYQASISNVAVGSNWTKYYIPIPDPSRLTAEKGMFFYSDGADNGLGYSFWIDEVKFENLGTVAHAQPQILLGQDQQVNSFVGGNAQIGGVSSRFNLPNGTDIVVDMTVNYLAFESSNESIATVNSGGNVSIIGGPGSSVITAKMQGKDAKGSLTVSSVGNFTPAPIPTHPQANVISLFSDVYTDVPVEYYNGYWAPFQTTLSEDFEINGDRVLSYTNFNFVGTQFSQPTINASSMTHLHLNIFFPSAIAAGAQFKIQLVDFGNDGAFGGGDDKSHTLTFTAPTLVSQNWITFDIPLANFTTLTSRAHLGQLIYEGTNISRFYADNIYFHN